MRRSILLFILILTLILSCKSNVKQQFQTNLQTLEILSPTDNQVFEAEAPIILELLTDLSFDENSSEQNKGYAKVTLDNNTILLKQKTQTFTNIKPGTHTLLVELFHSSNISYDISKGIAFKVKHRDAIINIISPKKDFVTNKTSIDVKLSVDNLDIEKEGYLLLTLNNQVSIINSLDHKFDDLKPGDYLLKVEPYLNDRSIAGQEKIINFKIEPTPPEGLGFEVWWPKENANIKGNILALSIRVSKNFKFGKPKDELNKLNEGHFHVFVNDIKKPIELYDSTVTISDLPAGNNKITVVMVQNDHNLYNLKKTINLNAQTVTSKA